MNRTIDLSPGALVRFWWHRYPAWSRYLISFILTLNVLWALLAALDGKWDSVLFDLGYDVALICFILASTIPDKIRADDPIQELNASLSLADIALTVLGVALFVAMMLRALGVL